jgi:hypothetical protein
MVENAKSKTEIVGDLLLKGTTTAEVLKATGWSAVGMPQMAKANGLELTKYDENGITKYKGIPLKDKGYLIRVRSIIAEHCQKRLHK